MEKKNVIIYVDFKAKVVIKKLEVKASEVKVKVKKPELKIVNR